MDNVKRLIFCEIPTSICNFRCTYCYLGQRNESFQGKQAEFNFSPEYVAEAFSVERLGGICFFNFCAEGETLLTKEIDKYIYEIVKLGHYVEIVTNLTITPVLERILSWETELLKRIVFKCSFHYQELLKKNMLNVFSDNVRSIWAAGSSANIEMVPSDDLIPYIEEIKRFSLKNLGALPQLTIARNDATKGIEYLTSLPIDEYIKIWSTFDSNFWAFKQTIFKVKRNEFCYAGAWSLCVNFATGDADQCYKGDHPQNIYEDIKKPIQFIPIGKCRQAHCYNGHAFLTWGCIPGFTDIGFGDIRDREKLDGTHWLQPELKAFFNTKLEKSNLQISDLEKKTYILKAYKNGFKSSLTRIARAIKRRYKIQ